MFRWKNSLLKQEFSKRKEEKRKKGKGVICVIKRFNQIKLSR